MLFHSLTFLENGASKFPLPLCSNALATLFQGKMNQIFNPFSRKIILVFFDNIIIDIKNIDEHLHT